MPRGTIKWFNATKGYGFILPESGNGEDRDVFVHWSAVNMDGFKFLLDDDEVQFDLTVGPKGPIATNVTVLNRKQF